MPVISRFSLTSGMHTGAGQASENHCSDALNLFSDQGRVRKRGGMTPVRRMVTSGTQARCGFAVGTSEPTTTTTGVALGGATHTSVYIGCTSSFNLASMYGDTCAGINSFPSYGLRDLVSEYWNGSAWTALEVAWVHS